VSSPSNSRGNNPMTLPFQSALSKGSSGNQKKVQYCSSMAYLALYCQILNFIFFKLAKLHTHKNSTIVLFDSQCSLFPRFRQ
jgi:hypothetical protein